MVTNILAYSSPLIRTVLSVLLGGIHNILTIYAYTCTHPYFH